MDYFEIVCNGKVARTLELAGGRTIADIRGTLAITTTGWCLWRAYTRKPTYPVLDIYPYGTTSPVYVVVEGSPRRSPEDATYFVHWIDHLLARTKNNDAYNTPAERTEVMQSLEKARAIYAAKQ
jgi:hypothetical protein